jgi:uncharacterized protein (TIGR00251 family)
MMNPADLQIRETAAGLEIRLHVQPRAKRCEISGIYDRALKVKVTAPPVDDAANRAIIDYFSSLLGIPKSNLQIVSGLKSRDKTMQIKGLSLPSFLDRVGTPKRVE